MPNVDIDAPNIGGGFDIHGAPGKVNLKGPKLDINGLNIGIPNVDININTPIIGDLK